MVESWPPPLRQQVQALLNQFLQSPPALIGTKSIPDLERTKLIRDGRVETLGSQPLTRAFVWFEGAEPQLWVDPANSGYRDLYDQFARAHLGLPGRPSGTAFNVDHVFPRRAGALNGLSHVRILAIGADANQSTGRTVEKAMAGRARKAPSGKVLHSATWMSIGKAAGFASWTRLPDGPDATGDSEELVEDLFRYLKNLGIAPPLGVLEHKLTAYTLGRIR